MDKLTFHKNVFPFPCYSQASFDLPRVVKFEPHTPRINVDSKKVIATQAFAAALKEHLNEILKQPVEARLPIIKTGEFVVTLLSGRLYIWRHILKV